MLFPLTMTHDIIPLDRKPNLYLKQTEQKGRGLFCKDDIVAGEELETTPALILNNQDNSHAEETILLDYVFSLGDISPELQEQSGITQLDETSCVVMGIASYCNHDEEPNAEVIWEETEDSVYYTLRATRDIPAGTEICTSYGEGWFDDRIALDEANTDEENMDEAERDEQDN